jgi:superfamily II DNA or RNA helicase
MVAIERAIEACGDIDVVVIVAPFQHLADQWNDELLERGVRAHLAYENTADWSETWALARHRARALGRAFYVLTTYATIGKPALLDRLAPLAPRTLFVADECHYLGAERTQGVMALPVPYRLGLSATPQRHFDDDGTAALLAYFQGIVFEYGLRVAIDAGHLTPYEYRPEPVELTSTEFEAYRELTERIGRAAAMAHAGVPNAEESLKSLARQRARLLNNAEGKLDWLREKLQGRTREELTYTLVYAGDVLFPQVTRLLGIELGIPIHAFTSEQSRKVRADLLRRFAAGDVSVLVAMKCLDEGVDVPPTRTAYFLASTSNPREFVQRRGRILRRSPGKTHAIVHDAIAVPPDGASLAAFDDVERATLRSQFQRIEEFGREALNAVEADRLLLPLRLAADLPMRPTHPGGPS